MTIVRTHVLLPEDLVREIDALVGPRGRSAFIVETARDAVRRKRLLQFLNSKDPAWKDENHPEGNLIVYYCDEHKEEGQKSPNK